MPQTSKEDHKQQLSSPGRDESSRAGTANVLRNALCAYHHRQRAQFQELNELKHNMGSEQRVKYTAAGLSPQIC